MKPDITARRQVALRKESVDRNIALGIAILAEKVALRKESVDRNTILLVLLFPLTRRSPQGERG